MTTTLFPDEPLRLTSGRPVVLCPEPVPGLPCLRLGSGPRVRVGARLALDGQDLLHIRQVMSLPRPEGMAGPAQTALLAWPLLDMDIEARPLEVTWRREGLSLAWVTLSDKGAAGQREDTAGPRIEAVVGGAVRLSLVQGHLLPDDERSIRALLVDLALTQGFDLIVTTGGTGLSPRDVTVEATQAVLERRLPGFEALMLQAGLAKTRHAAISRALAGTLGQSIIINLPGSPKAVAENLEPLLGAIPHALAKLQGDPADCAKP